MSMGAALKATQGARTGHAGDRGRDPLRASGDRLARAAHDSAGLAAYTRACDVVPALTVDRPPAPDIEAIAALIANGSLVARARRSQVRNFSISN